MNNDEYILFVEIGTALYSQAGLKSYIDARNED